MNLSILVLVPWCCVLCVELQKHYDGYELIGFHVNTEDDSMLMYGLRDQFPELDFWTEPVPGVESSVLVPPHVLVEVKTRAAVGGVKYNVVNRDIQSLVDSSYDRTPEYKSLKRRQLTGDVIDHTNFHPYDEIWDSLGRLQAAYPDNMEINHFGLCTFEERKQILVKVHSTPCPHSDYTKPVIVIEAGIHAREWISPAANLFFLEKLLKDYSNDDVTATQMLDTFDWYLIPVTNPDGYQYTWDNERLWRKNRRVFNDSCVGVDLNRNFDMHFGTTGVSKVCQTSNDIYPGEEAFSEPETKNIRDLVLEIGERLVAFVGVHAYSQLILVPWTWNGTRSSNAEELDRVGKMMIEALSKPHGKIYDYGTVDQTIGYNASGSPMDWVQEMRPGIYTYCFELRPTWESSTCCREGEDNCGFMISRDEIVPQGEEYFAAIAAMAGGITEFK